MTPEQRFEKLGLTLPPSPDPLGVYKLLLIDDNHAYISGHGTLKEDGTWIVGKVGADLDPETAKLAAQQVGLAILATLKKYLGSLDRVDRVIKVLGMVNAVPDFTRHPYVINGCSELFAKVWGDDKGVGVRSAVGVNSLPEGIPVEIEALFKLN
ncbi:MAG: RidA family protein [Cyclobacteriaceae bacterium]|jgi:enamine deaminase RidA (YjgF/YER057c/UK114 family)|nr:RidA family protein [Cyclobacteriaceae bacterium]